MPPVELFPLLAPLALVCLGALATLGFEAFLSRAAKHALLPWIGALFLLAAGAAQYCCAPAGHLSGMLAMDGARAWLCLAIISAAALSLAGLQQSLARDDYPGGEPYPLTLLAAAGAMLMVMAVDSIALFMGLELASLSVYALVGMRRHRLDSNEALFKYFAMGAVFSAIFLYGAALTYGATGSTHFGYDHLTSISHRPLLMLGQTLMIIGLLFKAGVVPFHFWSPDAYTGAPAAVTGLMGAVIKVGAFTALGALWLNLVALSSGSHPGSQPGGSHVLALNTAVFVGADARTALNKFHLVFLVLALLSLVLGNFSALRQSSVRRMIAFSSVAHAGYMLLAFALPPGNEKFQLTGLWYYLVGYAIATAGALSSVAALSGREDGEDSVAALTGRGRAQPFHGLVLTVFLVSFAGVPPTVGFLGKYLVFADLVGKGFVTVAVFAMIMAVVGAAFYFRLLVALWSRGDAQAEARFDHVQPGPSLSYWTLGGAALAVVLLIAAVDAMAPVKAKPVAALSATPGAVGQADPTR